MRAPPDDETEAVTRPLCVTMIFWVNARPRPMPPLLVVKNGRKIFSRCPGSNPGPLSRICER